MGELCSKVYFYFVNPSQHKRVWRFWDWWNISLRLQFCLLVCLVSKSPRISLTHAKLRWTTKKNNLVDLCRVGSFVILFFYHPLFYGLWPMTHSEQSKIMTTRIYTKILVLLLGCPKFWHYFWVDSTDLSWKSHPIKHSKNPHPRAIFHDFEVCQDCLFQRHVASWMCEACSMEQQYHGHGGRLMGKVDRWEENIGNDIFNMIIFDMDVGMHMALDVHINMDMIWFICVLDISNNFFDGRKTFLLLSFWMKHRGCEGWIPKLDRLSCSKPNYIFPHPCHVIENDQSCGLFVTLNPTQRPPLTVADTVAWFNW